MKNFKRIAAMVLAAVLALAVLTACSQSIPLTPDELGKAWIATELNGMNSIRSEPELENDPALEALCKDALGKLQDGTTRYSEDLIVTGAVLDDSRVAIVSIEHDSNSYDANKTYELTPLTAEEIESSKNYYQALADLKDTDAERYAKLQANYNTYYKVGFAYRIASDGTVYAAFAFVLNN